MRRSSPVLAAMLGLLAVLAGCGGRLQMLPGETDLRYELQDREFWREVVHVAGLTRTDEPAPAVCWLSDGRTTIAYDGGNYSTTELRRVKIVILDAKRAEEYCNVGIPTSSSHEVSNIRARTILKDGTVVPLDPSDIHERSRFPEYVLYADQEEKVFAMPAVQDSCVIEYEYTRASAGIDFEDRFAFDMFIPIKKASYIFAMPIDLIEFGVNITARPYGPVGFPEKGKALTAEGELSTLTWTWEDIPAIAREPYMPPFTDVAARVIIGLRETPTIDRYTWQILGDNYYASTIERMLDRDERVTSTAHEWSRGSSTPEERIEKIGSAVAENVRYVAVTLEGTGWTPQYPAATIAARYGDCKDVSVLTAALLRTFGIDAWPALVATRNAGAIDTSVVTPSLMNHMIVHARTAEGEHWLDPTAGAFKLGELPPSDRGVMALVLAEDGCHFRQVPECTADDNRIEISLAASIDESGNIAGALREVYVGDLALGTRTYLDSSSGDEIEKMLERGLERAYPGALVTAWDTDTEGKSKPCVLTVEFEAEGCAQISGSRMVLGGTVFGTGRMERTLPDRTRHSDVVFEQAYTFSQTVQLEIPEGWSVETLPDDLDIESEFGSFARRMEIEDGVVRSSRTFRLDEVRVDAHDYHDLREFTLVVDRAEKEPVLLVRD